MDKTNDQERPLNDRMAEAIRAYYNEDAAREILEEARRQRRSTKIGYTALGFAGGVAVTLIAGRIARRAGATSRVEGEIHSGGENILEFETRLGTGAGG